MFLDFNYEHYGFTTDEWYNIPRNDRMIIKSYVLNNYDREDTLMYEEYETVHQVRQAEKKYELESRPRVQLSLTEFNFPF